VSEPTPDHAWLSIAGSPITDELLAWPPDVFALTNVVLGRSEAFRFALSPVGEWPPARIPDWAHAVEEAGRGWSAWVDDRRGAIPDLVADEWRAFRDGAKIPLERLAQGRDWRMCEALLTLHAIADEACAGLGVALDSADGAACTYRACGRELLARTGSLARVNPRFLRVLPKVRTPPTGRAAFSRYACVQGPGIEARWHKIPARHRGTDSRSEYANVLLLPWPLHVNASDFRALDGSVQRLSKEPFGFFEFAPRDGLDLDLLDRVLVAARRELNSVDVVLLPESAVDEDEIDDLEALFIATEWSLSRWGSASAHGSRGDTRATGSTWAWTRPSRKAGGCRAPRANRGFTSARTSTTAGRSTKARSISTTSEACFTRTSAGGK
jgi:hypothetical protein